MQSADPTTSSLSHPLDRLRLIIVIQFPVQHFCPMYREIVADGRVDLLVLFVEGGGAARFDVDFNRTVKWQDDLLDGFPSQIIGGNKSSWPNAVQKALDDFNPDIVYVHGYFLDYLRAAMRWATRKRKTLIMTTDSELRFPRPLHKRILKRLALPRMLRGVDGILTVGDENERYYTHYGVPPERFHRVSFSIDSRYYDTILAQRDEVRASLRQSLGIAPDATVVLTVGKMAPHKAHADLIRAFALAREQLAGPAVLVIAGDGKDRAMLEELAAPLGDAIRLPGFIGVDELPRYYIASDLYVHPSSFDPHPLAISEALYCSLPVIASDRLGSIGRTDDVQEGRNGWVYPFGDVNALSGLMFRLLSDSDQLAAASSESRKLGEVHAADRVARAFVDGALAAVAGRTSNRKG